MDLIQYIETNRPDILKEYEIYKIATENPQSLIGRKVISIRSGFSSFGGTEMIIKSINKNSVRFIPIPGSSFADDGTTWSTQLDSLHKDVKFLD